MNLAYYELLGDAEMLNKEEENYASITAEDIQLTAKNYFTHSNSISLHYLMNEAKA
jgi:predicted Zn-dependent peptidase